MEHTANDRAEMLADAVWATCREISNPEAHEYLVRHNLKSAHGARVFDGVADAILAAEDGAEYQNLSGLAGALVVPMHNENGRRLGLQFITVKNKVFWPTGINVAGLHYIIGGDARQVEIICEGFATAAKVAEAVNQPIAIAFTAKSMGKVGECISMAITGIGGH